MADRTPIEWTDATWNPITGCAIVSPGCTNCYAMRLAGTRLQHHPSRAGLTVSSKAGPVWTGETRLNLDWLTQPLQWQRPRKIFVCAHGDLFAESVPDAWIDQIFAVMALCPQHIFQVLTKRADRMRAYFNGPYPDGNGVAARIADASWLFAPHRNRLPDPLVFIEVPIGPRLENGEPEFGWRRMVHPRAWPLPNVWLGVSCEDQKRANERIPALLDTPAALRFISAEPLLGPLDLEAIKVQVAGEPPEWFYHLDALTGEAWDDEGSIPEAFDRGTAPKIDWIIVGGESSPGARPMHPDWPRDIRDQCQEAGTPFFFKQWGEWSPHTREIEGPTGTIKTTPRGGLNWHSIDPQRITGMFRVGKKAAGRMLDGVEYHQFPAHDRGGGGHG